MFRRQLPAKIKHIPTQGSGDLVGSLTPMLAHGQNTSTMKTTATAVIGRIYPPMSSTQGYSLATTNSVDVRRLSGSTILTGPMTTSAAMARKLHPRLAERRTELRRMRIYIVSRYLRRLMAPVLARGLVLLGQSPMPTGTHSQMASYQSPLLTCPLVSFIPSPLPPLPISQPG